MRGIFSLMIVFAAATLTFTACNNTEDVGYEVPLTYEFENVDYSGQLTRIAMLSELVDYVKTGNIGQTIDEAKLQAMFENSQAPFSNSELNSATKDIKTKTFELDQVLIESFFTKLATASLSAGATGSNGSAGLVSSADGTKTYLFDENGYEYAQFIEKGLMGACFYYQILGVYLTEEKIGDAVDNDEVINGQGTAMEHHWDEAFGYTSLPMNYPNSGQELNYWGKYIAGREAALNSGTRIINAFLTGRAAISASDMETKNEMVNVIYAEMEIVAGATAIHYINSALNNYTDDALRNHALSEAWAFINALQYNPRKAMSTQEVFAVRDLLGDNFYEVSRTDLSSAKNLLANALGLNAEVDQL